MPKAKKRGFAALTPEQRKEISRKGGHARAKKLSAERRKEISRKGFQGMVNRHFDGNTRAFLSWFIAKGNAAQDKLSGYDRFFFTQQDPGPFPKKGKDAR